MDTFSYPNLSPMGTRYPVDTDCYAPVGEDRSLCERRLREESLKLFQIAGGGIYILCSVQDNESQKLFLNRCFATSEEIETHGITEHLNGTSWQHLIFIIQPAFSWSHLSITELAFRTILSQLQVFTPFLHVVHSFGAKTSDKQGMGNLAYQRVQRSSGYGLSKTTDTSITVINQSLEFCYNIRYFEQNGRGRGNPWSLRQTGVYQKYQSNKRSAWIVLNYSNYISDRVRAAFAEESSPIEELCEASPLSPHVFILSAAATNWRSYIESLRQKVRMFEEKAYSYGIDETYLQDYKLLSSDMQEMMILVDNISTASSVIIGQRDILFRCTDLYASLHKTRSSACRCDARDALAILKTDLQQYHAVVTTLARTGSKVTQLLSTMLASRASGNLQTTMATIRGVVAELKSQSKNDTDQLLRVTTQGHKDAAIIKTLTQAATMFLPATLMASLFSSTLFSDSGNGISNVGLYFAITVPLLLATLLLLIHLEKDLPEQWRRLMQNLTG
ncbi:hypothetical protein QBC38DRAFT_492315 [Podospora fimiseda]|uniref:CorA-like transporter domain-containing protein n=1 Tax=Podospora fimiseda TaxID=252190 RepID=A0AAN6YL53_9PEZI|nr:hypothetical protein QBC38DRAFT_492315 [Podospora fimiseda]